VAASRTRSPRYGETTDLVVQLSTGGAVTDGFGDRLAVLEAGPDACSLTCGTVNFGDEVFANPWPFIRQLYAGRRELGVVPEFELFDLGHIATLHRLLTSWVRPPAAGYTAIWSWVSPAVCRGTRRRWSRPWPPCRPVPAGQLPDRPRFSSRHARGDGRGRPPAGGLEDTLSYARGRPARGNAELVVRAAQLAQLAQRPPMTAPRLVASSASADEPAVWRAPASLQASARTRR